jgi:RNA polymerase sigma-70 factor (ECF subfamily)
MFRPDDTWESTLSLLTRARAGDRQAMEDLFARYAPAIRRWARGRLPRPIRDLADTSDVVQEALVQTFTHLGTFEHRGEGAFQAYVRQAVMNRIRDELRRANRQPERGALEESWPDEGPSPLDAAIGAEALDRYDAALQRLTADERDLVVARIELGLTYAELAVALGRPSADAARMAVGRALIRLAQEMGESTSAAD